MFVTFFPGCLQVLKKDKHDGSNTGNVHIPCAGRPLPCCNGVVHSPFDGFLCVVKKWLSRILLGACFVFGLCRRKLETKRKQVGTNMNILLPIRLLLMQGQSASVKELYTQLFFLEMIIMHADRMILLVFLRSSPFPQPRLPELPTFHS